MPAWKYIWYNVNTLGHDSMWDDFLIYLFTLETIIYLLKSKIRQINKIEQIKRD